MSDCEVKLVAVTKPVIKGLDTAEDFVAYAARVSNPANQNNTETSSRLLKYLLKHKHWSPFEMAHAVMEINTTRDIARQILRHRSFAFQEFSQRYANAADLGFVTREARLQDTKNRQASLELVDYPEHWKIRDEWESRQEDLLEQVKQTYSWALENGVAKEQARAVLPEGMTKSRLYMSGTLRSWIHFCQVRCDMSTQKEHREVAEKVLEILRKEFPAISELVNG